MTKIILFFLLAASAYGQDTTRVSLLFLGDIMQHDSQIAAAFQADRGVHDYSECFRYVKPVFESADVTIGNLELTLAGPPYKGYPQFSAPDALAVELKNAGVDMLVTANNHCVDRGRQGLERTLIMLDSLRIPHTGTFKDSIDQAAHNVLLIEKNGFSLALLNYTYGTNGIPVTKPNVVNRIDTIQMEKDLQVAKQANPDAVIVFFHWGSEYQSQPNAGQRKLADFCFQRGVKLVIGAHPHVLQPMEWRKEKDQLVVYSLGNFVSGQRDRYKNGGAMVRVELAKIKGDSTSSTTIEHVEHELQYVYRNARKKYMVLPVRAFEGDTVVVKEATERKQLAQFASDSRALLSASNLHVTESMRTYESVDSSVYRIEVDSLPTSMSELFEFYGVDQDSLTGRWWVGEFFDRETAEAAGLQLKEKGLPAMKIARFLNGRRED